MCRSVPRGAVSDIRANICYINGQVSAGGKIDSPAMLASPLL